MRNDLYSHVLDCVPTVSLNIDREKWPDNWPIEQKDDYYPTITLKIEYYNNVPEFADEVTHYHIDLVQTAIDDIVSDKIYFANKANEQT